MRGGCVRMDMDGSLNAMAEQVIDFVIEGHRDLAVGSLEATGHQLGLIIHFELDVHHSGIRRIIPSKFN